MATNFQRCTRCVMDNSSDTTITFDKNGQIKLQENYKEGKLIK